MGYNEDSGLPPGVTATDSTLAWAGQFGRPESYWPYGDKRISGAARDAGHSTTTILRPGLLMGVITASKMWKEWNPSGTDGSQFLRGILMNAVNTQRNGADQNRLVGKIAQFGDFKARRLLIPGESTYGIAGTDYEFLVRNALLGQFRLDDYQAVERQVTIAADTTIDGTFHNCLIDNVGAADTITITLPEPKRGLRFRFLQAAGEIITLASPASNEFIPQSGTPASSINLAAAVYGITEVVGYSDALYSVNIDDII